MTLGSNCPAPLQLAWGGAVVPAGHPVWHGMAGAAAAPVPGPCRGGGGTAAVPARLLVGGHGQATVPAAWELLVNHQDAK